MKRIRSFTWILLAAVVGCGGSSSSGSKSATVTGTVIDISNQPVRDAVVTSRYGSVRTSTVGSFYFPNQGTGPVEYTATITRNGARYRGRSTAWNYSNEKTQNVNIVIGLESELGTIRGQVVDRNGDPLQDASVYAYSGAGSSIRTFSDEDGNYQFDDLVGGASYTVLAGGQSYRSDSVNVTLGLNQTRTVDFLLDDPAEPNLQPPSNVGVVSWTSPSDATRGPDRDPYTAIKRLFDPKYRTHKVAPQTRAVPSTLYEVDLFWDEQRFPDLLGYGIYRGRGANGTVEGIDLSADPLAGYYVDLTVQGNTTYSYAVSTISSNFPANPDQTESGLSTRVVAETLGRLNLSNPTLNPLTFRWQGGSGAQEYVVYLFDEFPGVDVTQIWDNEQNRASGTSVVYNGPALSKGTYYYVVVGVANNDESRTVSQVGTLRL